MHFDANSAGCVVYSFKILYKDLYLFTQMSTIAIVVGIPVLLKKRAERCARRALGKHKKGIIE
jgi:hypothetical protein